MNKSLIPWCDYTWNPIVGCLTNCPYCYAKRLATTRLAHLCKQCGEFTPHLHPERLDQPLHVKKPALIFADSMSDWWSEGVELAWRYSALMRMDCTEQHRYVVLTKRPGQMDPIEVRDWPSNAWLGVSITSGADWWRWEALAALPERIHKFVSIEPLLGSVSLNLILTKPGEAPEWVIVGPLSGPNSKHRLNWSDLLETQGIRNGCETLNIPLFEKPGLPLQPAVKQMPPDLAAVFRKGGLT